jgi:hypothetical protein
MNEIAYFTTIHHGVPLSVEYRVPTMRSRSKPRRLRRPLRVGPLTVRRRPAIA